jgi:hypothetical protein
MGVRGLPTTRHRPAADDPPTRGSALASTHALTSAVVNRRRLPIRRALGPRPLIRQS